MSIKVFIVLDNGKDCYDAGGIYYGSALSREGAEALLSGFDKQDRAMFEIVEEDLEEPQVAGEQL